MMNWLVEKLNWKSNYRLDKGNKSIYGNEE